MDRFIRVSGENLTVGGKKIILRGFGVGSWMNLEHFMIGMPGPEHMIREAFESIHGPEVAEEFFHRFLTRFLTEDDFIFLKALGINVLRLPFNYRYFMDDQKPGSFSAKGFEYLDHVIGLCEKYEIYAILDLHAAPGGQNPDWHCDNGTGIAQFWRYGCFRDQTAQLWTFIAEHYKDNPWVGGYDLLNEPFFIPQKSLLNDFYDQTVKAIRNVDKNHVIFLEGDRFAMDFSMLNEPCDPQIAYEFHYYPTVWNPQALSKTMDRSERERIFKDSFIELVQIRERFHRPLWCGELGCVFVREDILFYRDLIREMLDLCEQYDVSWTLWAYKDAQAMGVVFPGDETPWMDFIRFIKSNWSLPGEMESANDALALMERRFFRPLEEQLKYRLQFRLRAIFHTIYVEQILKPRLRQVTSAELLKLPDSFLFRNCGRWEEIAQLIKTYTG